MLSVVVVLVPRFQPVILAPTFGNASTLDAVLRRALQVGLPVIVVDDGCGDESPGILQSLRREFSQLTVLTHNKNRGKAAALLTGFGHALQAGFTHALTIDTDGQLDPAEIPNLLAAAREAPAALVVGCRNARAVDYPRASRIGRFWSNFAVRWESGLNISDSQCGFRVYPLRAALGLRCKASRYGFETEVITRAAWAGVPIVEIPVSCTYTVPEGRVTHFRKFRDSLASLLMHAGLFFRSLLPWPVARVKQTDGCQATTGILWQRFPRWISPARV